MRELKIDHNGNVVVFNSKDRLLIFYRLASDTTCKEVGCWQNGYWLTIQANETLGIKRSNSEEIRFKSNGEYVGSLKQPSGIKLTQERRDKIDDRLGNLYKQYAIG